MRRSRLQISVDFGLHLLARLAGEYDSWFSSGTCVDRASYTLGTWSLSRGVKRPGRGVDHPPQSSSEVKERVELYLYSPSGASWSVIGWALPLPLPSYFYVRRETDGNNKKKHLAARTVTESSLVHWYAAKVGQVVLHKFLCVSVTHVLSDAKRLFVPEASLWIRPVFLNRRAAARYRALASIIPGRERPEETTICYKISLVQLITNLNIILYLSTCHTLYISVLILFMIMP